MSKYVKTRAGVLTVGKFYRLNGEDFYRRVNSDGTLTRADLFRPFNNNKVNRQAMAVTAKYNKRRSEQSAPDGWDKYSEKPLTSSDRRRGENFNYNRYVDRVGDLVGQYSLFDIPQEGETITISNGGAGNRARGAVVYTNTLDSIARNTGRYNRAHPKRQMPIKQSIGMGSIESMLGSQTYGNDRVNEHYMGATGTNTHGSYDNYDINGVPYISPIMLNSAWISMNKNTINPDEDALNLLYKGKTPDYNYVDHLYKNAPDVSTLNPYFPVYDLYLDGRSNPGKGNYNQVVTNEGNSLFNDSPEIQNWWNTSGQQEYQKGLSGQ